MAEEVVESLGVHSGIRDLGGSWYVCSCQRLERVSRGYNDFNFVE